MSEDEEQCAVGGGGTTSPAANVPGTPLRGLEDPFGRRCPSELACLFVLLFLNTLKSLPISSFEVCLGVPLPFQSFSPRRLPSKSPFFHLCHSLLEITKRSSLPPLCHSSASIYTSNSSTLQTPHN